ncbi:unnamed protein product [Leptosia nina]|uniref:Derlin n=1 Tax=Leptosia nina TaxID=320188 RepID=A0AAV1JQE5_9NEOP
MAYQSLLQEYMLIPPVTRVYTTACVITTLAVQLNLVSPFQLYFNPTLIFTKYQIWRYCRMLEEGSFRGRTADFVVMFIFGAALMIFCAFFINLLFLGQAFTIMIVYVWSRRNVFIRMNFFGIMNFQAPYLPFVLLGFSVLLGNSISVDVVGMAIGHIYYFLEDVWPRQARGQKLLKTPNFLKKLFDPEPETEYEPLPELANVRPGGFNWRRQEEDNADQPNAL